MDNPFFDKMIYKIYPIELSLNKFKQDKYSGSFLDLKLSITDSTINTKIYDKTLIKLCISTESSFEYY